MPPLAVIVIVPSFPPLQLTSVCASLSVIAVGSAIVTMIVSKQSSLSFTVIV